MTLRSRLQVDPVRFSPGALASLPPGALTRFAPSPTGSLHLGHVLHALYVWGVARVLNGRVLLRIEDHDRLRCRPEFENGMLELLSWLGLRPDLPAATVWAGPCDFRQSDCREVYETAARSLGDHLYYCSCSRRDLLARATAPAAPGEELPYDGFCRLRNVPESETVGLRLRLPEREVVFDDLLLGRQRDRPCEQSGDVLLRDKRGHWSYQFCVTVDDLRHRIDLVVRGRDLLGSTGRQILIRELLGGGPPPLYCHHALIHDDTGSKLGKSRFSQSIGELRALGATPEELFGLAAARAGWQAEPQPLGLEELWAAFARPP